MKAIKFLIATVALLVVSANPGFAADVLVYDGGGPQANIQAAMAELGIPFDLRDSGNPVTAADLATHDALVIGWNFSGNMTGVSAAVLAAGITGNVVITGHDAEVHVVHGYDSGAGGDAVDAAATAFLSQAIAYAMSAPGTGLVALGDFSTAFSYLPAGWGIAATGGLLSETVNSFTADGTASGIYAGLNPADMSNWGESYHAKFDNTGIFDAFELGGTLAVDVVTIGGSAAPFALDIKPGSCPNPLNVKSKGVLPVALLGYASFDVLDVDASTLLLEGVPPLRFKFGNVGTPMSPDSDVCDCNELGPDAYGDLVMHFDTEAIVAALGGVVDGDVVELTLTFELLDGTQMQVSDCVRILKKNAEEPAIALDGSEAPGAKQLSWGQVKAMYRR